MIGSAINEDRAPKARRSRRRWRSFGLEPAIAVLLDRSRAAGRAAGFARRAGHRGAHRPRSGNGSIHLVNARE